MTESNEKPAVQRTSRSKDEIGFTDVLCAAFGIEPPVSIRVQQTSVPAELFIKASALIPKWNLKKRYNGSPTVSDFLIFAATCPRAIFQACIIGKERRDERIIIEGLELPENQLQSAIDILLMSAEKDLGDEIINDKTQTRQWIW